MLWWRISWGKTDCLSGQYMEDTPMPDCKCLPLCPFFNDKMQNMPAAAALLKKRLCQGDNSQCARFMVLGALGRDKVPADLSPNQQDRAKSLIASGG
jgi:hypothetical protein